MAYGIRLYSTTAASNNAAVPGGAPEGWFPSDVNNWGRQVMADIRTWYQDAEWIDFGNTPTRTGATTFTVTGDQTLIYLANRRVKCTDSSTLYGYIVSSVYGAVTTVTVTLDSGSLSASLTAVAVGLVSSIPGGTATSLPNGVGTGNVTGVASSVDGEMVLFNSTTGKLIKRSTLDGGLLKSTSGVPAIASAGTDYANLAFKTIAVSGQSDIVADSAADTLTVVAGTGITLATNASTDTLTITNSQTQLFSAKFTSSGQTITAGGTLTIAHSLGAVPLFVSTILVCTSTEGGYSVNDRVHVSNQSDNATNNVGASIVSDSTNLNIKFSSAAGTYNIINKSTGARFDINDTKWQVIFFAAA